MHQCRPISKGLHASALRRLLVHPVSSGFWGTVQSIPTTIDITTTFMLHNFFLIYLTNKILGFVPGAYDKFPDFFHMGTFIDSKHMKL